MKISKVDQPFEFVYIKMVYVEQVFPGCEQAVRVDLVLLGMKKTYRVSQDLRGDGTGADFMVLTNDAGWEGILEITSWCKGRLWNLTDYVNQFPNAEFREMIWKWVLRRDNPETVIPESPEQETFF